MDSINFDEYFQTEVTSSAISNLDRISGCIIGGCQIQIKKNIFFLELRNIMHIKSL